MSCSMTRATRMSSTLDRALSTASAAACSHEVGLEPMMAITLYTLMRGSVSLTPQSDVHLRPEPRHADTAAPDHRLDAPRRGDEANQFRHRWLAGRRRQCRRTPLAGLVQARPAQVHQPAGGQVLSDRVSDAKCDAADSRHLLQRRGVALEDALL